MGAAELRADICRAAVAALTCMSPLPLLQNKSRVTLGDGSPP